MATNEEMLFSAFQEKVAIRSSFNLANMFGYAANELINFWDQTISKWPFFCNICSTQEMQNDWTMNIKQNVMSYTRITDDKFHTKKSKMPASHPFFYYFFSLSRKSWRIADL